MTNTKTRHNAPITHLLIDLDGTLVGNHRLGMTLEFMRSSYRVLRRYAAPLNAIRTLLAINREFKRGPNGSKNDDRVIALTAKRLKLSSDQARVLLKSGVMEIFPRLEQFFYPMPGAQEFIAWAKEHYPLILATNPVWPEEIIRLRSSWGGIDSKNFGMITHVRAMTACKPNPTYYKEILEQAGIQPNQCLLVGNDLKMDLPATAVGIRTFIVGDYSTFTPIRNTEAPAWRGSFLHLKSLLQYSETQESRGGQERSGSGPQNQRHTRSLF